MGILFELIIISIQLSVSKCNLIYIYSAKRNFLPYKVIPIDRLNINQESSEHKGSCSPIQRHECKAKKSKFNSFYHPKCDHYLN